MDKRTRAYRLFKAGKSAFPYGISSREEGMLFSIAAMLDEATKKSTAKTADSKPLPFTPNELLDTLDIVSTSTAKRTWSMLIKAIQQSGANREDLALLNDWSTSGFAWYKENNVPVTPSTVAKHLAKWVEQARLVPVTSSHELQHKLR